MFSNFWVVTTAPEGLLVDSSRISKLLDAPLVLIYIYNISNCFIDIYIWRTYEHIICELHIPLPSMGSF